MFTCRFWYAPFQVLKRAGIKGPTPTMFYGNIKEMFDKVSIKGIATQSYC